MYYIYHIPGVKIGCTQNLKRRMKEHKYPNYEVLETHIDIEIASERERQLQKQYGYKIDSISFIQSLTVPTKEGCIKGGITQGNINKKNGHAKKQFQNIASIGGKTAHQKHPELYSKWGKELGKMVSKVQVICPYCGKVGQRAAMYNWHFDKCKKKPTD